MKDIVSINRSFLLLAREQARDTAGTLLTGVPKEVLDELGGLSYEQIDALASELPVMAFTVRFSADQLKLMLDAGNKTPNPQYAVSVLAANGR